MATAARRVFGCAALLAALCLGCAALCLGCAGLYNAVGPTEEAVFTTRSADSTLDEFAKRMDWRPLSPERRAQSDYEISHESFRVYRPPAPGGREAGLLVWMSPNASGSPPADWCEVLDRHGVIWVGANGAGDARPLAIRINLAIDAAHNIPRRDPVDAERIYVGGYAGGARAASVAATLYPDVFRGGLYIGGADYFRPLPSSDPGRSHLLPHFPAPAPEHLALARARSRFAFVTGGHDPARFDVRDVYDGYREDGFRNVALFEAPRGDRHLPDAEWFERALNHLDLAARRGSGPAPL